MKYRKYIGAIIGFVIGNFIGAIIGFIIGSLFDSMQVVNLNDTDRPDYSANTGRTDFLYRLALLSTAIMNADGKVTRTELNYVKGFFRQNFGEAATLQALQVIKNALNQEVDLAGVCNEIRYSMDYASRNQLLYFLFGLAKADGEICDKEIRILESIAYSLGMDTTSFNSIKSMYYNDLDSAYATLGTDKYADDSEIKKAYRKMAVENHPDKVGHLGEDIRKAAEEKFTMINLAYEKIKKQRGIA